MARKTLQQRQARNRKARAGQQSQLQEALEQAVLAHQIGNVAAAEATYRQLLPHIPHDPYLLHYLGMLLAQTGRFEEGKPYLDKSLNLQKENADFCSNYGSLLHEQKDLPAAEKMLRRGLVLAPNNAALNHNLAVVLTDNNRPSEALAHSQAAISHYPNYVDAINGYGNALLMLGDYAGALQQFEKALGLQPNHAQATFNTGLACSRLEYADKAVHYYNRALQLKPDDSKTLLCLCDSLFSQKEMLKARAAAEKALEVDPDCLSAHFKRYRVNRNICDWTDWDQAQARLTEITHHQIATGTRPSEDPMGAFIRTMDKQFSLDVAKANANHIKAVMAPVAAELNLQAGKMPCPKDKLKIGYMSCNFKNHPNMHLVNELMSLHDHKDFEIYAYSHGINDGSDYRKKVESDVDVFHDISTMSSKDSAQLIHNDGIDILINLNGVTDGNRLDVLALRPAPVQAVYLGYPNTTGADFVDYIITDEIVTPAEDQPFFPETFAYKPGSYQLNHQEQTIADRPSRAELGLPEDAFVFCCFNTIYKLEPEVFSSWMRIMKAVPNSILWLLNSHDEAKDSLRRMAEEHGIDGARLHFAEKLIKPDHLARLQQADLFLDTFICNAHVTTSDSLWAGVPVLTRQGSHFASRVASSLLTAADLPEMITTTTEAYEKTAIELAQKPEKLQAIRQKLWKNRETCALFDAETSVRQLEDLYRAMWKNACDGRREIIRLS